MVYAKKSLGQNFLIDNNIIKKITNLIKIKDRNIIEIGPGKGALTNEILKREPKNLTLIEKDSLLAEELKLKYFSNKNIKVYNFDILKIDVEKLTYKNSAVFGNLPYNISSQILVKALKFKKWPPNYNDLIFMFQKELGEKIIGKFNTNNYGRLSILTNYKLNIIKKFFVSSNCFFPKPKVTSMVIHFKPKLRETSNIKDLINLEKTTNIFFSNKRKMINKSIKKILSKSEIKQIVGLNITSRPAEIKPEIYYKIAEIIEKR